MLADCRTVIDSDILTDLRRSASTNDCRYEIPRTEWPEDLVALYKMTTFVLQPALTCSKNY